VQADTIVAYDSGVAATVGTGGAADPISQGWVYDGKADAGANSYADDGGWRTVDAWQSSGWVSLYKYTMSASNIQAIDDAGGWIYSATASMDSGYLPDPSLSATDDPDAFLPSTGLYAQNNSSMWIEVAGKYRYWLTFESDSDGDLIINDKTNQHEITTAGNNAGFDTFFDFTLTYDADTDSAVLNVNGSDFSITPQATGSSVTLSRVIFGNVVSSGRGSVVWNEVNVSAVPEPGSLALLGAGAAFMLRRRRNG
jgi:hypothetical protein